MGLLAFVVFTGALMITVVVMMGTLLPAWPRIVEALVNAVPAPEPRLVLARSRVAISQRPNFRAVALREAA